MLSVYDQISNVPLSITNTHVSYDEIICLDVSTVLSIKELMPKRSGIIPQLVLASSVLLTAPAITAVPPAAPDTASISSSRIAYGETALHGKRISLHEARQIALKANKMTEDGLREDRAQEARIMASTADEDEHT